MNEERNDLQKMITQALEEIKEAEGEKFDLDKINLALVSRKTGLSRSRLRRIKANGFIVPEHGLKGKASDPGVLSGYTGLIDDLLRKGITNSVVSFDRLREAGYGGSLSTIKRYIAKHKDLVPAKRHLVEPQGNRGRRYSTGPGETYQMDWGFVNVETGMGATYRAACFAMICHHCGKRYVEFFPNAKQENLFIGMIHAFLYMGVPKYILTDNMKSVIIRRDHEGHPIWHREYLGFMNAIGFDTKLCKPRHPFTKGKVERLIRFVKENFMAGRIFSNVTELNHEALRWCERQNGIYQKAVDCIPEREHGESCLSNCHELRKDPGLVGYLCPERKISFDGFVTYEGRRFGVPYWYTEKSCRVMRERYRLHIYSSDMKKELTVHDITWSRRDSYCEDQFVTEQPEEFPTAPVKTTMFHTPPKALGSGFEKFNFEEGLWDE